MSLKRGKTQVNVKKELERLSMKLRKTGSLSERDIRKAIEASYGTGRQGTTGDNNDYEEVIVKSSDGIFSFVIMTDSSLL